jgi:GNAT superfamily N-acetyltransferase
MAITIRPARIEDVPAFVEAGRQIHATTRFRSYDYDSEKLASTLRGIVEAPHGGYCFIAAVDDQGQAVGWVIGCVEQQIFSNCLVASIIHFGVLPGRRMSGAAMRLLAAFRGWAENRGAFELAAGVSSGVDMDKMDRFYRKLGFRLTGGNYAMTLPRAGLPANA